VASTTTVYGETDLGLSRLDDGALLADTIASDPAAFFDAAHRERFGTDPALLIKLLDAGERLPVHLHPDDAFAQARLGTPFGKTEGWLILDAEPGARVHLGFRRQMGRDELADLVADQDIDALLTALNPLPVAAGDCVFVPAGLPHAIGTGILLLELQQPSDLSLMLEWEGVDLGGGDPLLGLEPPFGLSAVHRRRLSDEDLLGLADRRGSRLFPAAADVFFRAERLAGDDEAEQGFAIVVAVEGAGELSTEAGGTLPLQRGDTALIPHAAGGFGLSDTLVAYACRPPIPH
jgi:mannose-6-phosphate isomerase